MKPLDWLINDNYSGDEQRAALGPLLSAIDADSSDPIWMQLRDNTRSGWEPAPPGTGFKFTQDDMLIYANLPPLAPVGMATHLGERIFAYPHGFVLILQLNQSYSLARIY